MNNLSSTIRHAKIRRYATLLVMAIALAYGLLAALHTLREFDLGWQLATGRWVLAHKQIPSTDVFSYTARGQEWIYPVGSSVALYGVYRLGGYALLSWLGAAVCLGTIALLVRWGGTATAALALLAVPLVAYRTEPRAEMFTTLLFAAFLSLLWQQYRTGRSSLWVLPVLMVAWVNLHLGFSAGLAICAGYLLLEVLELPFPSRRETAILHLRSAWPWLLLTGLATFANPWGPYLYAALIRQERVLQVHSHWLAEWTSIPLSWPSLQGAFAWRDPQSGFWWLLATVLIAVCTALWRRRLGACFWLAASAYLAIQHIRFQGLFACIAVVVGGDILSEGWQVERWIRARPTKLSPAPAQHLRWLTACTLLITTGVACLAGVRASDLVSNRYYLRTTHMSEFGPGISWWYPERAARFVERQHLPANIFNPYDLGGYLTWRLGPEYPDYIDGRAVPFGDRLFFRAYDLTVESPESLVWQREADARNINTIIVSLDRYEGVTQFPQLRAFCHSQTWRPVYMDEVSAIFVRSRPETAALIDGFQIDCEKVIFTPPADLQTATSTRGKAELFNFWANAAGVLHALGRYTEALVYCDRAQTLFADSASLHFIRAQTLQGLGHSAEAEGEFRSSIRLEPTDENWFALGRFYATQSRFPEAGAAFRTSAQLSAHPHDMWLMLGQVDLHMNEPYEALAAFDRATQLSPFVGEAKQLGSRFYAQVSTGRAVAAWQLGDTARAISFQEMSVNLAPEDPTLWEGLARLYQAEGRPTDAQQALMHVKDLQNR